MNRYKYISYFVLGLHFFFQSFLSFRLSVHGGIHPPISAIVYTTVCNFGLLSTRQPLHPSPFLLIRLCLSLRPFTYTSIFLSSGNGLLHSKVKKLSMTSLCIRLKDDFNFQWSYYRAGHKTYLVGISESEK